MSLMGGVLNRLILLLLKNSNESVWVIQKIVVMTPFEKSHELTMIRDVLGVVVIGESSSILESPRPCHAERNTAN